MERQILEIAAEKAIKMIGANGHESMIVMFPLFPYRHQKPDVNSCVLKTVVLDKGINAKYCTLDPFRFLCSANQLQARKAIFAHNHPKQDHVSPSIFDCIASTFISSLADLYAIEVDALVVNDRSFARIYDFEPSRNFSPDAEKVFERRSLMFFEKTDRITVAAKARHAAMSAERRLGQMQMLKWLAGGKSSVKQYANSEVVDEASIIKRLNGYASAAIKRAQAVS